MFNNLGWGESAVLLILALLVFGPERLPRMAAQAGRMIRQFRLMAAGVTDDLKREIGAEDLGLGDIRSLDPRKLIDPGSLIDPRRLLDDDDPAPRRTPAAALGPSEPAPFDPDAT